MRCDVCAAVPAGYAVAYEYQCYWTIPYTVQVEFLNLLLIVRWNVQQEDILINLIQILSGNQYQNLNRLCSLFFADLLTLTK